MRDIARRLISAEQNRDDPSDTEGRSAFRVCDRLRRSLSVVAGTRGFRSLLSRALTLASAEAPWLRKLHLESDGSLVVSPELEGQLGRKEITKGGAALVVNLLELLVTFIGETLTLRLVQQVWPKAALNDSETGGKA